MNSGPRCCHCTITSSDANDGKARTAKAPAVDGMASQEKLLLEFNLSDPGRRHENDELISKLYCDVIGKVDEKGVVGLQILCEGNDCWTSLRKGQ